MILIIGGGAAGLACARALHAAGADFLLLEATDRLGGRVRTDVVDGFLLDHGFQILLTSYPHAQRLLDYNRLGLQAFRGGARIREGSQWHQVLNPLTEGVGALADALGAHIGTAADKLRLARLAATVSWQPDDSFFRHPAPTTLAFLRAYGFSERIINLFFRPFFGGVFLDRDLATSGNMLRFTFKQFLTAAVALPAAGIGALATELAHGLPPDRLRLSAPVASLRGTTAVLTSGELLTATAVVIATDATTAAHLLGTPEPAATAWRSTTVVYYAAPASPQTTDRLLALNSSRRGLLHNACVPSAVQPTYAPAGAALVSVSSHGGAALNLSDAALDQRLRAELADWYGAATVQSWRWLRAYRVPRALPVFGAGAVPAPPGPVRPHTWVAGDHWAYPSLNAALGSGLRAAAAAQGGR